MTWFTVTAISLMILATHSTLVHGCQCGIENVRPRIINGRASIPYTFPWVVNIMQVGWFESMSCTGSVIAPDVILTAAHCVPQDQNPRNMYAFTYQGCGRQRMMQGPRYGIARIIRHPKYEAVTGGDDIALLILQTRIPNAMPICLPTRDMSFDNLLAAGWGKVNVGLEKKDSECLNQVDLAPVSSWLCWLYYRSDRSKVMCAGGETNVCQGDSGGPLMSRVNGLVYQAGVTSFTRDDCGIATKTPAGFERVFAHIDWIRQNVNGACFK